MNPAFRNYHKPLHLILLICMLGSILSCSDSTEKKAEAGGGPAGTAGKDYLLLKRYRIVDPSGFSQPVEAVSFLLPEGWTSEGGVNWNTTKCLSDMVQLSFHAVSPDNKYELFVLPTTQFDWVNNAQMMDALRRGGYGSGCTIAEPMDAASYIRQVLPGLVKANAVSAAAITEVEEKLRQQAAAFSAPGYTITPSVAEGKLQFPDGSEGIALCSISQIVQSMQGYDGSAISHFQTAVNNRLVLRYPAGEEQQARKILGTIQGSVRLNMTWMNALNTMFNNIRRMVQDENWKRVQITQQAQQEISNNIVRSWEKRNESSDKTAEWFSQYIRGVDSWTDEGGNKVELVSGYSNAWQREDGSYLLVNDPSFDPNVSFQEKWKRMGKQE